MEPNAPDPGLHSNPWNRLDAKVGMALAYWAYPHKDIAAAEKVVKFPEPWEHAKPGSQIHFTLRPKVRLKNQKKLLRMLKTLLLQKKQLLIMPKNLPQGQEHQLQGLRI